MIFFICLWWPNLPVGRLTFGGVNGHLKMPTGGHENCPLVANKNCPVADTNLPMMGMAATGLLDGC